MFTLTPSAAEQIVRAATAQPAGNSPPMLRVAAKHDERDGELVYGMGFDDQREDDLVVDGGGIKILIAPSSQSLLENTTLDFTEIQPGEFQFVFFAACATPPAQRNCGSCGGGCA